MAPLNARYLPTNKYIDYPSFSVCYYSELRNEIMSYLRVQFLLMKVH